jgi:hypothetical protein
MQNRRLIGAILFLGATIAWGAACNQQRTTTPDLQTTTGVQPRDQTMTVKGCLKSGALADDTFLLTVSQPETGTTLDANYQLVGGDTALLRDHVGQQVEVSGALEAEQKTTATSGTIPETPTKGASGTPAVSTQITVDVKRLNVDSVKPTGDKCAER